jgi:hypothetical protein
MNQMDQQKTSDAFRLRDSAFLIAAVALPLAVVALFLLAAAIPRWTVAPPAYDLLVRADGAYRQAASQVVVTFRVRDGRLEAALLPGAPNAYQAEPSLFAVDSRTGEAREIPLNLPSTLPPGASSQTIVVAAIAGRRVLDGPRAPDGYNFEHRYSRGPGLIGDVFGMSGQGAAGAIVKDGRVVPIELPPPHRYAVEAIGWLEPEGSR